MTEQTILVVDDNRHIRRALRHLLQLQGYEVREAGDGRSALELVTTSGLPDLLLLEIVLPDMNGFELLRRIRSCPGGGEIRAVAVTGFISGVQRPEISAAGLEDLLPKPIDAGRLLDVLNRSLGRTDAASERMRRAHRVLLVNDDPLERELAAACLAKASLQPLQAGSALEAAEMARGVRPDAVLSNVLLPDMDGFEFCQLFRTDPHLAQVPVVLMSSSEVQQEELYLALGIGASALVACTPGLHAAIAALVASIEHGAPDPTVSSRAVYAQHLETALRRVNQQSTMIGRLVHRCSIQASMLSVLASLSESLRQGGDAEGA